jgi:hypothetical protein
MNKLEHHIYIYNVEDKGSINMTIQIDRVVWLMVFNTTFNNISVISWRSVLLVEETGVPGEKQRPVASH